MSLLALLGAQQAQVDALLVAVEGQRRMMYTQAQTMQANRGRWSPGGVMGAGMDQGSASPPQPPALPLTE